MPRKPTLKQRKVAQEIVAAMATDTPPPAGEILEKTGYGPGMVKNPQDVLQSDGVRQALSDLGFSIDAADTVVTEIMHTGSEAGRLNAADKVYKRLGAYAPEKSVNLNLSKTIPAIIQDLEEDAGT